MSLLVRRALPSILLFPALAHAQEDPASTPDELEVLTQRVELLESELAAVEAELLLQQQAAVLREAEALARDLPPLSPAPSSGPSRLNPGLTAFGDVLGTAGLGPDGLTPGSGPWLRSLELDLRASVDPFANAVAVLAVHQEAPLQLELHDEHDHDHDHEDEDEDEEHEEHEEHGGYHLDPEEVYVDFVALPRGLSLRAGRSRQPFGITNRAHPHDYPWATTPLPLVQALGHEGYADVGANASWLLPLPPAAALTVQAGVVSGRPLDPEGQLPGWIGRAEIFGELGRWELGVGASATGSQSLGVWGSDLMLRWRASSWKSAVLLVEVLGTDERGGYAALQLQPTRSLYVGARTDTWEGTWHYGGYVSWYSSEFLRLRLGAMTDGETVVADTQLTFVWGSHPVEPYWVNR